MTDDLPRFELTRVESDGTSTPQLYPVGPLPPGTVADRRGFLGASLLTAGALGAGAITPAFAQSVTLSLELEGTGQCADLPAAQDTNRAHSGDIVDLQVDTGANAVITRDFFGKIRIWSATTLKLELTVDVTSEASEYPACGYFLRPGTTSSIAGKAVLVGRQNAYEIDLADKRPTLLVSGSPRLREIASAAKIRFIDSRLIIALIGRKLTWLDLAEDRIRLEVPIPGDDPDPAIGLSPDGQWLAVTDQDGVQLWSVHRGVRVWHHPFDDVPPPKAEKSDAIAGARPQPAAVGFVSGDRHVIAALRGRRISVHDRKSGEILVKRLLRAGAAPTPAVSGPRASEIDEAKTDDGLKALWDAGYGPALWTFKTLTRRCVLKAERREYRITNRVAIHAGLRRGFTLAGTSHVSAWDLARGAALDYLIDPELAKPPAPATSSSPSYYPSSPGYHTYCTCNKVCTCIPVRRCQAHELLDDDPVVRAMAEELLLSVGTIGFDYLAWAAEGADAPRASRIHDLMRDIGAGRRSDLRRWPDAAACLSRIDGDGAIGLMAAQWLRKLGAAVPPASATRVARLLDDASRQPWQELARAGHRWRGRSAAARAR